MASCYHCQSVFPATLRVERSSECPQCHRDIRVCANCRHYSPGAHLECRESINEAVRDKERRNFCEWFALAEAPVSGRSNTAAERERQARVRFESLFRNGPDE